MSKAVRIIPPTIDRYTMESIDKPRLRKVAAYARVSTDMKEQLTSYEAQIDYYTKYIKNHEGWEFVKVYTDEGITGTSTKKRDGFNEMIKDALDGKVDLIVTKSVSRFARNTVDSLSTIQKLRDNNVECYFEKENVYTFDSKGDLLLTFMSGMAQEEARNISENTTWGQRKRFADGEVTFAYSRFLGYDKGENGKLIINEKQAELVRRIFTMYLQGYTFCGIARRLTEEGIPTVTGKTKWRDTIIKSILTNEKYKGDALLQKSYTVDFLSKKVKKNNGEVQQYYIEKNHDAIIEPETFDAVQYLIKSRKNGKSGKGNSSVFSCRVICGDCGNTFGSKVWHSNDKYRRVIWQCNKKFENNKKCTTPHFSEEELREKVIKAINELLPQREKMKIDFDRIKTTFDTENLREELMKLTGCADKIADEMDKMIERNSRFALNQNEFNGEYSKLEKKYLNLKKKINEMTAEITKRTIKRNRIEDFFKMLDGLKCEVTDFNEKLIVTLVDKITVYAKADVRVTFVNGTEITV